MYAYFNMSSDTCRQPVSPMLLPAEQKWGAIDDNGEGRQFRICDDLTGFRVNWIGWMSCECAERVASTLLRCGGVWCGV